MILKNVLPFVSVFAFGLLLGCDVAPPTDTAYDGMPPNRFRGDVMVPVIFSTNVEQACYDVGLKEIPGTEVRGCTLTKGNQQTIIISNPCWNSNSNYKIDLCHEIGHVNGWPGSHGP